MSRPPVAGKRQPDRGHYERLHDSSLKYRTNNWLLDELPRLIAAGGTSILEVGCGNGRFLDQAARHWAEVVGVDWVRSAVLDEILGRNPGVRFLEQDVADLEVERPFDLVVSADFLEHISPAAVPDVLRRLHACGRRSYHKIACYDDGHSHLSVFKPAKWLRLFERAASDGGYRIISRTLRHERRNKPIVIISNIDPEAAAI
jgi:SAM-dependent methyltransferase